MAHPQPVDVAIVAFPEVTAGVVFGMLDLFHSAGRDWGLITARRAGTAVIHPRIVAQSRAPMVVSNGVPLTPDATFADAPLPDDRLRARDDGAAGRAAGRALPAGDRLSEALPCRRRDARHRLLGRDAAGRGRSARRLRRHDALGVLRHHADALSGDPRAQAARAGGERRGPALRDGRRRHVVARSRAVPDRALRRRRRGDGDGAAQSHRLARRRASSRSRDSRDAPGDDAVIARCQTWIADQYREPAPVAAMGRLSGLPDVRSSGAYARRPAWPPRYVDTVRLEGRSRCSKVDAPIEAMPTKWVTRTSASSPGAKREVNLAAGVPATVSAPAAGLRTLSRAKGRFERSAVRRRWRRKGSER